MPQQAADTSSVSHEKRNGVHHPPTERVRFSNGSTLEDIELHELPREFSLKSFKCFAREHPLLLGFGAAGFGAAFATVGAGYVLYRGAQRKLPQNVRRLAQVLVTF